MRIRLVELDCNLQSISGSIEGSLPENIASWQAEKGESVVKYWETIADNLSKAMELGLRFSFALRGANGENFSAMIDCDEDQAHYRRSASSPFHYIGSHEPASSTHKSCSPFKSLNFLDVLRSTSLRTWQHFLQTKAKQMKC